MGVVSVVILQIFDVVAFSPRSSFFSSGRPLSVSHLMLGIAM
jgi:hypothetical protein